MTVAMAQEPARGGLWVIVPAAGRGTRFGADRPKQHVEVAGRSLLLHTPRQMRIVICCADGSASPARAELFADFGFEHCYSLDGGYAAWRERRRQTTTPARAALRSAAAF